VTRRLIDEAGIHRPHGLLAAPVSAAAPSTSASRSGRPARLRQPAAYLVDRVTRQAWSLTQVASELGIDGNTVRDRLNRHGLRRTRQTAR
jgi:hypothetical protein